MITVSEEAKNEVTRLKGQGEVDQNAFIRVGVKGGGCSGLTYNLEFDKDLKEEEDVPLLLINSVLLIPPPFIV